MWVMFLICIYRGYRQLEEWYGGGGGFVLLYIIRYAKIYQGSDVHWIVWMSPVHILFVFCSYEMQIYTLMQFCIFQILKYILKIVFIMQDWRHSMHQLMYIYLMLIDNYTCINAMYGYDTLKRLAWAPVAYRAGAQKIYSGEKPQKVWWSEYVSMSPKSQYFISMGHILYGGRFRGQKGYTGVRIWQMSQQC